MSALLSSFYLLSQPLTSFTYNEVVQVSPVFHAVGMKNWVVGVGLKFRNTEVCIGDCMHSATEAV